jgi:PAS domain S-box-containing protein
VSWEEVSVYPTGEKHGEVSVTPIFDEQGQCTHLIGAVHDITERVKAERVTRESEEKFRTLSEKSPNMIFINQAGRVVYANEASEAIMGYTRAELTSSDFNFLTLIAPESVERVKQNFQRHVGGEDIPPQEYQLVTRDGRRIDGIQSSRLVQYDGKPAILGIITDITDRKRAEERIREQADDLGLLNQLNDAINRGQPIEQIVHLLSEEAKRIFSVSDASVYLMSPDKQHLVLSVQTLSGEIVRQAEELLGRQIPTPKVALREGSVYLEALRAGRPTLIHGPGQIRKLMEEHTEDSILKRVVPQVQRVLKIGSVILLPLISEDEPIGLLAVSRDRAFTKDEVKRLEAVSAELTTTIKRKLGEDEIRRFNVELEQRVQQRTAELETANKELEAFSYSVSHDLRAPLRAIDGFSQALLEENAGQLDDAGQDYLRRVRAGTQRMGTLIDDLLGLSRVARVELRREKVALTELARAIVSELAERDPERRVKFVADDDFIVDGDSRLLRVALENLLRNAWKFTQERSQARIDFGQEHQAGSPVFFVRDNGAGFDMAYVDKLFGAFQRLHPASEFPGTGVGLATVQRIIHRHGGRVWAEGKVDHGATFYFTVAPKGNSNG